MQMYKNKNPIHFRDEEVKFIAMNEPDLLFVFWG